MDDSKIVPIFIIGSARNGTTNLENTIAALPEIAGIEHWLHHGSHESNLYKNKKYWGNLSNARDYVSFLYHYSSSDYFKLCKGDVEYHLNHPKHNFYSFFFDLMDHYAQGERKKFWITKLDQKFFLDKKERELFFQFLNERYHDFKIIRIKRNFADAFKSYINMEGKTYRMRQHSLLILPALLLQASRHVLTYDIDIKEINNSNKIEISFENYISNREKNIRQIADFLDISVENFDNLAVDRFKVNSSFVQSSKRELTTYVSSLISFVIRIYQAWPGLAQFYWNIYYNIKKEPYPIFHRIIYFKYFKEQLVEELTRNNAIGLLEKIKAEKLISAEQTKSLNKNISSGKELTKGSNHEIEP